MKFCQNCIHHQLLDLLMLDDINIFVIGLGNIGRRHMESILTLNYRINLYLVDSNKDSILKLNNLIQNNKNIYTYTGLESFTIANEGKKFMLGIIATDSSHRIDILEILCKRTNFEFLICEKLLGKNLQQIEFLRRHLSVFTTAYRKIFVNCPMRCWPIAEFVNKHIHFPKNLKLIFGDSNWNIGSNLIHLIDFYEFLAQQPLTQIKLNTKICESKRLGYHELRGMVYAYSGNNSDQIFQVKDDIEEPFQLLIQNEDHKIVWNGEHAEYWKGDSLATRIKCQKTLQSKLTSSYVNALISRQTVNLPCLKTSIRQHELYFEAINELYGPKNNFAFT